MYFLHFSSLSHHHCKGIQFNLVQQTTNHHLIHRIWYFLCLFINMQHQTHTLWWKFSTFHFHMKLQKKVHESGEWNQGVEM